MRGGFRPPQYSSQYHPTAMSQPHMEPFHNSMKSHAPANNTTATATYFPPHSTSYSPVHTNTFDSQYHQFPPQTTHYLAPQPTSFDPQHEHTTSLNSNFSKPPMPSTNAQGHLTFVSNDVPSSNPVITMSEKFAGTCQIASPKTLVDPSWFLDSGATNHV